MEYLGGEHYICSHPSRQCWHCVLLGGNHNDDDDVARVQWQVGKLKGSEICWLDYENDLLVPGAEDLKKALHFDDAHLSPELVPLLEQALGRMPKAEAAK